MATVKRVYTEDELDAMNPDDFYEALGLTEKVHAEIYAAREAYHNGTRKLRSWREHVNKYGMD